MKIQFEGAAQTVTGSQTILNHHNYNFMIDCGLYQGARALRELNWQKPNYVEKINSIILTHAHIDHSGLLPKWSQWNWNGKIFCTHATADLLSIMLLDAARLQEEDARFANVTKHSSHNPADPLYTEADAKYILNFLCPVDFNSWQILTPSISFRFVRAGHILGSAIVQINYSNNHGTKILTFSGDIGGGHSDLLKEPEFILESDSLVLESTYGNRKINVIDREEKLAEVIRKVISRNGTLVIPSFALGHSQDLLFSIYKLFQENRIPKCPIYLDSPMANSVTEVYSKHLSELKIYSNENYIEKALSNQFFRSVVSPDDSMLLCLSEEPKIILSASGMLQGGRVMHHLKTKLPDKKNAVLFVGFQGQETKGRLLKEGISSLRIHHQEISVEAEIFPLDGYSAHADSDDLMKWLKAFKKLPSNIFLNHGEAESQVIYAKRIKDELNLEAKIPKLHDTFEL